MIFSGNVDLFTIVIYIVVAFSISYITRKAMNVGGISSQYNNNDVLCSNRFWNLAVLLILVLTMFATFRLVGVDTGGRDTLRYMKVYH